MRYVLLAVSAAFLFAGCGRKNEPIVSHGKPVAHWLEELKQPDPQARTKAVVALGHVGNADPTAIPSLIGVVKNEQDATVRNAAILALLNIGPAAKDAVPVLTEAQSDNDATISFNATKAVERIQGTKKR